MTSDIKSWFAQPRSHHNQINQISQPIRRACGRRDGFQLNGVKITKFYNRRENNS